MLKRSYTNKKSEMLPLMLVMFALGMVPVVFAAFASHTPTYLLEVAAFGALTLLYVPVYFLWLARLQSIWGKLLSVACTFGLAALYTAVFSKEFSNAYLVFVLAVQVIFALEGPGPGIAILVLAVIANVVESLSLRTVNIEASVFACTILVAVGLLTWHFASTTDKSREKAEELTEEVTKLNRLILTSHDNERFNLAREIHDGPLQSMGVQLLAIDRARRRLEAGEYDKALQELTYLRSTAEQTVGDLRQTVSTLRNTLLDSGLEPALANLARKTNDSSGVVVTVEVHLQHAISEPMQVCLYQLAAEALDNVKSHASAGKAHIQIDEARGNIALLVRDDGKGFDYPTAASRALDEGRIGLHTMRERARKFGGTMSVRSEPGHGTEVSFVFPLDTAQGTQASKEPEPRT